MELDLRSLAVEALDRQLVVDHGNDDAAMLRFQRFIDNLAAIHEIEHLPERLRRYRNVEEMFDAWEADEAECRPPRKRLVSGAI